MIVDRLLGVKTEGRQPGTVQEGSGQESEQSADGVRERLPRAFNELVRIRRITDEHVEDVSGRWYSVWEVNGEDSNDVQKIGNWARFLAGLDFPVQILVRQHVPDLSKVRENIDRRRPDFMREGEGAKLVDSVVDWFSSIEERGDVLDRRSYVVVDEGDSVTLENGLFSESFSYERQTGADLAALFRGCAGGRVVGGNQERYQAAEYRRYVRLADRYVRSIELKMWPRLITTEFLEGILQTGYEMDLSMYVAPLDDAESETLLRTQKGRFEGSLAERENKGMIADPEVTSSIVDATRLWYAVQRGESRLYWVSLTMAVFGQTVAEVERKVTSVALYLRSKQAAYRLLDIRQGAAFAAVQPALRTGVSGVSLTDLDTLIRLFPFSPPNLDTRDGILFGVNRRSSAPVMYDRFELSGSIAINGHMMILAQSGAGKSFFTKLQCIREVSRGVPVYLIDPDGEYTHLARQLNGRVLNPGRNGSGMNPFLVKYSSNEDMMLRIANLGELIQMMLRNETDNRIRSVIDGGLVGFYDAELAKVASSSEPVLGSGGMGEFVEFLRKRDGIGGVELAAVLEPFVSGTNRYLFSSGGDDLMASEAPITVFNLRDLNDNLKPVATSVCSEVVWSLAMSDPRNRMMVVDECWSVLKTSSGANALLTIVKRARKYNLSLVTISQDLADMTSGSGSGGGGMEEHAGVSMILNSGTKMILMQDAGVVDDLQKVLGLSDEWRDEIAMLSRGHGIMVNKRGKFLIEVVPTNAELTLLNDTRWLSGEEDDVGPSLGLALDGPNTAGDLQALKDELRRALRKPGGGVSDG